MATTTLPKRDAETMILGSGELYTCAVPASITTPVALATTLFNNNNFLCEIEGGASLEYKPTFYTAKSDSGKLTKTIITDEEATLKSGLVSKIGSNFDKLAITSRTDTTTTTGKRVVKIGGIANANLENIVFGFWHKDAVDGDIQVIIIGKNQSGFTLAFQKDKETIVDMEIKAEPIDSDGSLIYYIEESTQTITD